MLPFTHEQFLAVFSDYNSAIWPAQLVAYAIGIAICALLISSTPRGHLWIAAGLALLWAWTGTVYHATFFARINRAAVAFGGLFVLQAALLVIAAARGRLRFARRGDWRAFAGWGLIVYATVLYPVLGMVTGLVYPRAPEFGVAPCPLTLFTWGILLMAEGAPSWLLVVPFAWALVGGTAAFLLHVPSDWILLASSAVAWAIPRRRQSASDPASTNAASSGVQPRVSPNRTR